MTPAWLSRWLVSRSRGSAASPPDVTRHALDDHANRALCDALETLASTFTRRAFDELRAQLTRLTRDLGASVVVDFIARQDHLRPSLALARCLTELLPDDVAEPYLERLVDDEHTRADAQIRLAKLQLARADSLRADVLLQSVIADDIHHAEARRLLATTHTAAAATPGATLFGAANVALTERYTLHSELGRGAEGVVYLADDLRLSRKVAIKIFHARAIPRQSHELQFFRRLHGLPRDPMFIRIFDLDPRDRFFVMEFCGGGSLADVLANEMVHTKDALTIAIALCQAIERLGAAELVHGDLKPTNILFRSARRAPADLVLSDFGRTRDPDDSAAPLGTLAYMSPAALRAENSAGQDLFALGIIFLELLGVPDVATLRRQMLADGNPAPALFAAIPPARLAAFAAHEAQLRAIVYALLAESGHAGQILAQLILLKKDLE